MIQNKWSNYYGNVAVSYPPEYIIRIFKGTYPDLKWDKNFIDKKICDISAGDGRNLPLLKQMGFEIYATEISEQIVDSIKNNIKNYDIDAVLAVGDNDNIPFDTNFFDYTIAWNCSYYINPSLTIDNSVGGGNNQIPAVPPAVKEYARITKNNSGYLILSIPKKTCFIYRNAEYFTENIVKIKNDPFKIRNNTFMYVYKDAEHIKNTFKAYFDTIAEADIHDNCFGFNYHWHILIMQRNNVQV